MTGKQQITAPARCEILGVGISAINLEQATSICLQAISQGVQGYICVTGVHGIMESQRDPELYEVLNNSFLSTPDGMPTVWLGRAAGLSWMDRVYGPDLMLALCDQGRSSGVRHYFYGGNEGVAEELVSKLTARYPGINIVGNFCPPFRDLTEEEINDLDNKLSQLQPDIVWVGLSTPKQEKFMAATLEKLTVKLMIGVGAAFDFHSGRVQQAPRCVQRSGFEWLYRTLKEPRRLWKRYYINNTGFLIALLYHIIIGKNPVRVTVKNKTAQ